jgi:dTDP-4-amino-4,6-dideoxygalactose transaminase
MLLVRNKNSPVIGIKEFARTFRILRSGSLAQGSEVKMFETELAENLSRHQHAVVNSGTSALVSALSFFHLSPGDEVIVPSFTFAATANAVVLAGGVPIFADIDEETFTICPESIESVISKRTVGIVPVHLYGLCANMVSIMEIATRFKLFVVEDAAQAHLASIGKVKAGEFGNAACFSFYPTKNMTSLEGGSVTSGNPDLIKFVQLIRNQGMLKRYENEIAGFNFRLTEIAAGIGRAQLSRLPKLTQLRQRNARLYQENLKNVKLPKIPDDYTHVFHQFTIRVNPLIRDELLSSLRSKGISADVYYPTPVHQLKSFSQSELRLPVTERVSRECISLPVGPKYRKRDIRAIVRAVNEFVGGN